MSVEKIIQEALNRNPVALKETLEEELRSHIALALEAKMNEKEELEDDIDESFDLSKEEFKFIDFMLDEGCDLDDIIDALVEQELEEGSIKGSGTDRKAQLKKAYRAGEQKTRDFYKSKLTKAPRTSDKGIKKAFAAGAGAGDGSPTTQGIKRSSSQDDLKGTNHDQSSVSPTSKSFRSTHSWKMDALRRKPKLPK